MKAIALILLATALVGCTVVPIRGTSVSLLCKRVDDNKMHLKCSKRYPLQFEVRF